MGKIYHPYEYAPRLCAEALEEALMGRQTGPETIEEMAKEVNFSDRTPSRTPDGHNWYRMFLEIFVCSRCEQLSTINPISIRTEDRIPCKLQADWCPIP